MKVGRPIPRIPREIGCTLNHLPALPPLGKDAAVQYVDADGRVVSIPVDTYSLAYAHIARLKERGLVAKLVER